MSLLIVSTLLLGGLAYAHDHSGYLGEDDPVAAISQYDQINISGIAIPTNEYMVYIQKGKVITDAQAGRLLHGLDQSKPFCEITMRSARRDVHSYLTYPSFTVNAARAGIGSYHRGLWSKRSRDIGTVRILAESGEIDSIHCFTKSVKPTLGEVKNIFGGYNNFNVYHHEVALDEKADSGAGLKSVVASPVLATDSAGVGKTAIH